MIMFDGVEARPMPERRMEKAMMNRGKLVTMIRMPGAIDSTVRRPKVRMIQAAAEPSIGTFRIPEGSCWAAATAGNIIMMPSAARIRIIRRQRS